MRFPRVDDVVQIVPSSNATRESFEFFLKQMNFHDFSSNAEDVISNSHLFNIQTSILTVFCFKFQFKLFIHNTKECINDVKFETIEIFFLKIQVKNKRYSILFIELYVIRLMKSMQKRERTTTSNMSKQN